MKMDHKLSVHLLISISEEKIHYRTEAYTRQDWNKVAFTGYFCEKEL